MDNAVEQYKPYKFALVFESYEISGYVTEKIVNAFLAGVVPIYWGNELVREIFNPQAFVNAADFENLESLADYVISLANSPVRYQSMRQAEPLLPGAMYDYLFVFVCSSFLSDSNLTSKVYVSLNF